MKEKHDVYAGDAAWREWFEMCAVSRCDAAKVDIDWMFGDVLKNKG